MPNLLDLMSPEDKEKALQKASKRLERKKGSSVSPEIYMTAEFGYYFGWDAIVAIKRGYIEDIDDKSGKVVKNPFTLQEAMVLLEAARKVWYSKLVENANTTLVANHSVNTKSINDSFKKGMKPYKDRASM